MNETTRAPSSRFSRVGVLAAAALLAVGGTALGVACGNSDDSASGTDGGGGGGGTGTDAAGGGGGGGGTGTDAAGGGGGGGGGGGSDSGTGTGSDGGTGTDSGGGGGGGLASSCSTGTVFAGDPVYMGDPSDRPASGTAITADPPLLWHNMVWDGNLLYTQDDNQGVWVTDTSAAKPVETLVAGGQTAEGTTPFNDGTCTTAHFAGLHSIAVMPDHSILAVDYFSAAIMHITNPTTPATCAVAYYAGNNTPSADEQNPIAGGDVNGPGATAQFMSPSAIATDAAGNAYVFDEQTLKIRKIANDGPHTVTTLATVPSDGPYVLNNLLVIGSKVYGVGSNNATAFVLAFDTTSGAMTTVASGTGPSWPPLDDEGDPLPMGITTDGTNLIVAGSGYIWYVTMAGQITLIAGTGIPTDFPVAPYNPAVAQPAMSLVLPETEGDTPSGSLDYLSYHSGSLYFRGHFQGTAYFIEKIACP